MKSLIALLLLLQVAVCVFSFVDHWSNHRGRGHHWPRRHGGDFRSRGHGLARDHSRPRADRGRGKKLGWLPDWDSVRPWMRGDVNLGPHFNMRWDFGDLFGQEEPWWDGPNVCMTEEESEEAESEGVVRHHVYTSSVCDESETAYKCVTSISHGGKKKKITIIHECCHGYQREKGQSGCPTELRLLGLMDTMRGLGLKEFTKALDSTGLAKILQRSNHTVFAPTDEALKKLKPIQAVDPNIVVVTPELRDMSEETRLMLLHHTVPGMLSTSKLEDEELIGSQAQIRINKYDRPKHLITANCVPLISTDNMADKGVVHTIGQVLLPVEDSILDIVSKDPQLSYLKTLLSRAELVQTLKDDGQFTLFAPTNAAFRGLAPSVQERLRDGHQCIGKIMRNHLLPNVICSSIIEGKVNTLNSLRTALNMTRDNDGKLFVEGAQIVRTDIMGTNGVLHIIDAVLVPDQAFDVMDIAEKEGATEFVQLAKRAGLEKRLKTMTNFTVFIPSDEAFENLPQETRVELRSNPGKMAQLLRYHIVPSQETCARLHSRRLLDTLDGDNKITVKEYYSAPFGLKNVPTVECAALVKRDLKGCDGVAHLVNKVLMPPSGDVLDTLSLDPQFSTLISLLKKAEMAEDMQSKEETFTFFAPTNQAFESLGQKLGQITEDPQNLKKFLQMHIMRGYQCCSGVFDGYMFFKQREKTLEGGLITLNRKNGQVFLNRHTPISRCDMTATNGVVHALDEVLPAAVERYTESSDTGFWGHVDEVISHVGDLSLEDAWEG